MPRRGSTRGKRAQYAAHDAEPVAMTASQVEILHKGTANAAFKVTMQDNQTLKALPGSMLWGSDNIKIASEFIGFGTYFKKLLTGVLISAFDNKVECDPCPAEVVLSNNGSGDAVVVELPPGATLHGTYGGFVACSENIAISRSMDLTANVLGAVSPMTFTNTSLVPGILLIKASGGMSKLQLPAGEKLLVDQTSYVLSEQPPVAQRVGGRSAVQSFLFGGEGFVFAFTGPQTVHVQTVVRPTRSGGGGRTISFGRR